MGAREEGVGERERASLRGGLGRGAAAVAASRRRAPRSLSLPGRTGASRWGCSRPREAGPPRRRASARP
jgi:hypothetical protein